MQRLTLLYFLSGVLLFAGGERESADLLVYAYDSFVADFGLGPMVREAFSDQTGKTVDFVSGADAVEIVGMALSLQGTEAYRPDVLIGIDNNMRFLSSKLFQPYTPSEDAVMFYADQTLVPYDYGYVAVVYDREHIAQIPRSLEDLTHPRFAKSLVLMDPRTSSPGLAFLYWSIAVYGNDFLDYWERLKPSIITITDSWVTGYGMLLAGETPMVLSYTSSPAYHMAYEDTDRYQFAHFDEGHYLQIEYAGITRYARDPDLAKKFIDALVSLPVQKELPLTNIMYPIRNDVRLPESFLSLGEISPAIQLSEKDIADHYSRWIIAWTNTMSQ